MYLYRLTSNTWTHLGWACLEHLLQRGRGQGVWQEEDRREEHHRPDPRECQELLTNFNTLYLLIYFNALNLIAVKALDLPIYSNALKLIIVKAPVLLNYFNNLNPIVVKALDLLNYFYAMYLLIYLNALILIVVKALYLLIYFNALNLLIFFSMYSGDPDIPCNR